MRLILTCLILLITLLAKGQNNSLLTAEGQKKLLQIYQQPLSVSQKPFHYTDNHSIENDYLRLYSLFIAYQASEKQNLASGFNAELEQFEKKYHSNNRYSLMYSTLLIQQSFIHWNTEAYTDGIRSFYKAHRVFSRTDSSLYTSDYHKLSGLFKVFISQIPEQYQFWTSLLGLRGDMGEGFQQLKNNMNREQNEDGSFQEACVLYSYCLLKFGNPSKADIIRLIQTARDNPSPGLSFVVGSLAVKKQMGQDGIDYLATLSEEDCQAFPLLYHVKGRLLLNVLDSAAVGTMQTFRECYKGHSFRTDALMRQAWWWHIKGDASRRDSLIMLTEQQTVLPTSNDKQAQKEIATLPGEPVTLLKARLLFDGGYYENALAALMSSNTWQLGTYYLPEYHYRLGRINQALNKHQDALMNYDIVIGLCLDDKRYFGPYAALEAAAISIQQNQIEAARNYLFHASELNNGQYKDDVNSKIISLKQQLKQP